MRVSRPSALLVGLICLAGAAPTMGQSLAAAARAEEARRQKNRDDGVKVEVVDAKALDAAGGKSGTLSSPGTPGNTAVQTPPSGSSEGATRASSRDGRDESYWRARVRKAEARLAETQAAYDRLASMSLVPGYVYQDSKGKTVISSIGELQAMTASAKAERDAAQKALEDVHEDARRSGALPGWLR
jgi:hypothetical protein